MRRVTRFSVRLAVLVMAMLLWLPCMALPAGVYRNHENNGNKIALTFDDGPHPRYTPEILDILDEYHVHATFFVVGENVHYYPEVAREVARRGHEIGNHTFTHPCAIKQKIGTLQKELAACESEIQNVTDTSPKLFRPPQGSWNTSVYQLARQQDYDVILWDIDTLDWAHTPAEQISENVLSNIKSGDIILMHDYHSNGCTTTAALRLFLPVLLERGYQFVTVSELIGSE